MAEDRPALRPGGNTTGPPPRCGIPHKPCKLATKKPSRTPKIAVSNSDLKTEAKVPAASIGSIYCLEKNIAKSSGNRVYSSTSCSSEGSNTPSSSLDVLQNRASSEIRAQIKLRISDYEKGKCGLKSPMIVPDDVIPLSPHEKLKKRCGWITSQSDDIYIAFHDNEWGVPVHDDNMLFELLVLSGALAEFSWPVILSKRDAYREVFAGFDPALVAAFDEKEIACVKSNKKIMLHEGKIRGIVDNAKCILKIVENFGSFDNYLWGYVNHKPIVNRYRYPRQVLVKTPKAELISKDMVKRGFRFVGPTIMYSFMQVAGITNDHLVHCFRYGECIMLSERQIQGRCNREDPVEFASERERGEVIQMFENTSITRSQYSGEEE